MKQLGTQKKASSTISTTRPFTSQPLGRGAGRRHARRTLRLLRCIGSSLEAFIAWRWMRASVSPLPVNDHYRYLKRWEPGREVWHVARIFFLCFLSAWSVSAVRLILFEFCAGSNRLKAPSSSQMYVKKISPRAFAATLGDYHSANFLATYFTQFVSRT